MQKTNIFFSPTFMFVSLSFSVCLFVLIYHIYCLLGVPEHDKEGRVITAEYEKFFLVTSCKFY